MAEQYVTGETLVGEVVTRYPEAIEILLSIGMHCLGCPASRNESLQDACAVHGIPAEQVIEAFYRFFEEIGIPMHLGELGVKEEKIEDAHDLILDETLRIMGDYIMKVKK